MAEAVIQDNELTALHITLKRRGTNAQVVIEAQEGVNIFGEWTFAAEEIGVPGRIDSSSEESTSFNLPARLLDGLRNEVLPRLDGDPLWLHLDEADVNLPLVPWEKLLGPLGVPILRVPYYYLPPVTVPGTIDIAICASTPNREWGDVIANAIEVIAQRVLADPSRKTVLHIFPDYWIYDRLMSTVGSYQDGPLGSHVILKDPTQAPKLSTSSGDDPLEPAWEGSDVSSWEGPSSSNVLINPWLKWMHEELLVPSVDTVAFICPGEVAWEEASLKLSESPMAESEEGHWWGMSLNARDISSFLTLAGAGAVVFISPSLAHSVGSLRLLQHQVALARAGSSVFHDLQADPDASVITEVLRVLHQPGPPPTSSAFSMYCHPHLVGAKWTDEVENRTRDALSQYTLVDGSTPLLTTDKGELPAWVLTAQRSLEQSTAQLIRRRELYPGVVATGTEEGMKFVTDLIEKYQSRFAANPELSTVPDPADASEPPRATNEDPEVTAS